MTLSPKVLVVEDSLPLAQIYKAYLSNTDYDVVLAATLEEAMTQIADYRPDIVLLDVELPDGSGIDLLKYVQKDYGGTQVIVMTAHGSSDMAVDAINLGATDFLTKPFDASRLLKTLDSARGNIVKTSNPIPDASRKDTSACLVGSSALMKEVNTVIQGVAASIAPAHIYGETGTCRDQVAEEIHSQSPRAANTFMSLNCAIAEQSQLERELFGAIDTDGALARCNKGTLFLDNVSDLPEDVQKRLLRFVHSAEYTPIGTESVLKSDVRLLSGGTQQLSQAVDTGAFRGDLFYRLHVVPLELPPLRARLTDMGDIATAILTQLSVQESKAFESIEPEALEALAAYDWPGNFRELENLLRQLVIVHNATAVTKAMLPKNLLSSVENQLQSKTSAWLNLDVHQLSHAGESSPDDIQPLWMVEKQAIEAAIDICGGNINRAASYLEVAPSTIYRKVQAWNKVNEQNEAS